jgi:RNA polymerase sigma-70 factor (ECF subfamily)
VRSGESAADRLRLMADELRELEEADRIIPTTGWRRCSLAPIRPSSRSIRALLILQTLLGFDAAVIASAFLGRRPPWVSGWCARRERSARPASRSGCRSASTSPRGWMSCWRRSTPPSPEGWSDPAGTKARRRNLAQEGTWLGRLVVSLMPDDPEALALVALTLHAEARHDPARQAAPLAQRSALCLVPPRRS